MYAAFIYAFSHAVAILVLNLFAGAYHLLMFVCCLYVYVCTMRSAKRLIKSYNDTYTTISLPLARSAQTSASFVLAKMLPRCSQRRDSNRA